KRSAQGPVPGAQGFGPGFRALGTFRWGLGPGGPGTSPVRSDSVDLILLGAPGAGKGTQGALLASRLAVPKIATGDMLRDAVRAGTPLGREAKHHLDAGTLVPDAVILGMVRERLEQPDA